jgi:hypothetical protein
MSIGINDIYYWLDTDECELFIELLENNTTITSITFPYDSLNTHECYKKLNNILKVNTTLTYLDIALNVFDHECWKLLIDGLKMNSSITQIEFYEQFLNSVELKLIADMLEINRSITNITIYYPTQIIDNDAIIYFINKIKNNTILKHLQIPINLDSEIVCKHFAKFLKNTNTINYVYIQSIGELFTKYINKIVDALEYNFSITTFKISHIITDMQFNKFEEYCNRNEHNINLKSMLLQDICL